MCCSTTTFSQQSSTFQPGNNTVVGTTLNPTTTFAQESSTFQPGNNTSVGSNSNSCKNLRVDKSKIDEVLSKQGSSTTTNIVNIKISIVHGKKTPYLQELELPWASEFGRTIIHLVRRARDSWIFTSPIFTFMLEVGTEEVDIQITEETDGCLPSKKERTDWIFDSLLHQLSHSLDKRFFKLCRINDESIHYASYNCCRIAGERNLTICAEYSSAVVEWALPIVVLVFLISFFMILPFVLQYIIRYPTTEFYKTSESHMSLCSLASKVFFEGCGPVKSFFRRCVFAGFASVAFVSSGHSLLQWVFIGWLIVFVFVNDIQMTNENGKEECIKKHEAECAKTCEQKCTDECKQKCIKECEDKCTRPQWDTNIIKGFTLPFWLLFRYITYIINSDCIKGCKNSERRKNSESCCEACCHDCTNFILDSLKCLGMCFIFSFSLALYVVLVALCLLKFCFIDLIFHFVWPHHCPAKCFPKCLFFSLLRLVTLVICVLFTGTIFIFALSVVVGLTLNAEYFNPFIAPILTMIIYFWKNWKFSVEAKCLQLKTLIIEVCKEKAPAPENGQISKNSGTNVNGENNNKLAAKDRFLDFLYPCFRDTSRDQHIWRCGKNLCCCSMKDTNTSNGEKQDVTTEISGNRKTRGSSDSQPSPLKASGDTSDTGGNNAKNDRKTEGKKDQEQRLTPSGYHEEGKRESDRSSDSQPATSNASGFNRDNLGSTGAESDRGNGRNKKADTDKNSKVDNGLVIKFDKHGEAMISIELYKKVEKEILRLDQLVFYFFRRMILVGVYVLGFIIVMVVVRESGLSESVQLISAIAGALILFVFDTIFAEHHISQKNSRNAATREKLEHILKVNKYENNTIFVEVININNDKSQGIEEPVEKPVEEEATAPSMV